MGLGGRHNIFSGVRPPYFSADPSVEPMGMDDIVHEKPPVDALSSVTWSHDQEDILILYHIIKFLSSINTKIK